MSPQLERGLDRVARLAIPNRISSRLCGVAVVAALLAGCDEPPPAYDGPERAAVAGKVTFNNQPVTRGTIMFKPADGKGTRVVLAAILEGEYTLPEHMGPELGAHEVQIRWIKRDSTGDSDPTENEGQMPNRAEIYERSELEQIPEKYNDKTELKADVKSGTNEFNYALNG